MAEAAAAAAVVAVPTVHWAQSPSEVYLKLEIPAAVRSTVSVKVSSGSSLSITASSAIGDKKFALNLKLFSGVFPAGSPQVVGNYVEVVLSKTDFDGVESSEWPRLLAAGEKVDKNKIKVDWDRFQSDDLAEDAKATAVSAAEKRELSKAWAAESARMSGKPGAADLSDMTITPEQAAAFGLAGGRGLQITDNPAIAAVPLKDKIKACYLFFYNFAVLVGLLFVFGLSLQMIWTNMFPKRPAATVGATEGAAQPLVHSGGFEGLMFALSSLHARVGKAEYIVQGLASLEILHSAVGLIQGRVLPSFLLNGGRNIILYGLIMTFPVTHGHWSAGVLYLLWCVGDLTRYTYYLMALVGSSPVAKYLCETFTGVAVTMGLTHQPAVERMMKIRYTLPLILLPFGFITELAVMHTATAEASNILMPFGEGITLTHVLYVYAAAAYLLGAPFLYMAVLTQRKSKCGGGKGKGKGKKKETTAAVAPTSAATKKAQ